MNGKYFCNKLNKIITKNELKFFIKCKREQSLNF